MASIQENDTLAPLLEFMFDFLQGSHGKMVDASRFDIRSFELDQSETYEKETQWLLVHLYFLCLRHVANMTKNWWLYTKKRVKGPVETWTEKHVSNKIMLLMRKANFLCRSRPWLSGTRFRASRTGCRRRTPTKSAHWR